MKRICIRFKKLLYFKKIPFLISIIIGLFFVFLLSNVSLAAEEECLNNFRDSSNEVHTGNQWCAGATNRDTCESLSFDFCSLTSPTHISFGCKWIYMDEECVCDTYSFSTETCVEDGCIPWECEMVYGCEGGQCYQSCSCGNWTNDECGGNACAPYLMHQTRGCEPVGSPDCSISRCVSNPSCSPSWYPACPFCLCDNPNCQCGTAEDGGEAHNECQNQACVSVSGAGTDECYTDTDCVNQHRECQNTTCVLVPGGGTDECQTNEDCGEVSNGEEEEVCYPPDCCYVNTDTSIALAEGGVNTAYNIINESTNYCKPGNNWKCVDSTVANYEKLYNRKKKCEDNCVPPTGPPLPNRCSCAEPFDAKTEFDKITTIHYGPWSHTCWIWTLLDIDFNVDPICWTLRLLDFPYNSDTHQITLEGDIGAGEALWNWILKPFIASQIQKYSVIGSEGCETCVDYEGEKNVIFHPAIHVPQNFCLVYNFGDGTCTFGDTGIPIPVIGGQDIQLAPGICAWLRNMGYIGPRGGIWGDIWVNLNPFVKAETLEELIENFINFLLLIGLPLALLFFILGGVMFMTASGNPERVGLARRIILYTAIGLIVILFAKGLIYLIQRIIGG